MINRRVRIAIAGLALSLSGYLVIIENESYTERAVIPTINDVPTVGLGSTFNEDGSPVKMGDTITPPQAIKRSAAHIAKDEARLKKCVTGKMAQEEYNVLVDFSYQYGVKATCDSSMVKHINAGRYEESCQAYTLYKRSGGYDCSTLVNGKPNKRCWGVWQRNLKRRDRCLGLT